MRTLKFRAYDSATGKVSEPFDVKESWGDYLIDFEDYSTDGALDSIIWEQFTGLLDRNGKEIYEGDIIESTWNGDKAEVVWNDVEGEWEHYADFNTHSKYSGSVIVGNIHENPELLGGEK